MTDCAAFTGDPPVTPGHEVVTARRPATPLQPFSEYTYDWLTVDPVAAAVRIAEQPALPSIVEPNWMPPVDAPVDEPMVAVVDRAVQLPAPYWHVGWPAAVSGTFLRADVARRLV